MDPILIFGLLMIGIGASIIGAIFGLGGGIIFIPVLTIIFGLTANEAVAVSLVGIVATSTGAAAVYVKSGLSNVRLGLMMEITTSIGAICGAVVATYLANWLLLCIFSMMLIYSAIHMIFHAERITEPTEEGGEFTFSYMDEKENKEKRYKIENIKSGLTICTAAGMISSMTGVGGGVIKVPLMNIHMHVPIKIASATSSYMIGITAFSGAIVYFLHGDLLLEYAAAIAIGACIGSMIGTRIVRHLNANSIRKYFSIVLLIVSILILFKAGGYL